MDITIECDNFRANVHKNGNIELTIGDAILDGCVSTDEIVNEYSASALLDEIDNDDIIEHLENQGYTVTKD